MPEALAGRISKARRALDLPAVDYEATMAAKLSIARELFDLSGHSELEVAGAVGFRGWNEGGLVALEA